MAFSKTGDRVTVSGTETIVSAFSDAFNSPSGNDGTHIDRIPSSKIGEHDHIVKDVGFTIASGATFSILSSANFLADNTTAIPYLDNNGSLVIGSLRTFNSVEHPSSQLVALNFVNSQLEAGESFRPPETCFLQDASGTSLSIYGAAIQIGEGSLLRILDGNLAIKDSIFYINSVASAAPEVARVTIKTPGTVDIDGLTVVGNGASEFGIAANPSSLTLNNFKPIHMENGFTTNGHPNNVNLTLFNYNPIGCTLDFAANNIGDTDNITFVDSPKGNALTYGQKRSGARYALKINCTKTLTGTDGTKYRFVDTNNGSRNNILSGDQVFSGTFSNGAGGTFEATTGTATHSNGGTFDDRLPLEGIVRLYGRLDRTITLESSTPETLNASLISDPIISLSEAAAGALTGITINHASELLTLTESHSGSEIYDRHAWDLFQDANILTTLRTAWFLSSDGINFTCNYDLTLSGTSIVSAGNLAMGANTTLTLGTASSYERLSIPATGTVNVDACGATLDLAAASNSFADGAAFEITDGGSVTITVASSAVASQLEADKLETSGSITFSAPVADTTISGFPSSNNANGIAPTPVLGIFDASDNSFIAVLTTADDEYNGDGSFTIVPGDYAGNLTSGTTISIRGDAVGWRRTAAVNIDTSDPPSTLDISAAFDEYLDEAGVAFIGSSAATTGLTYDQANARFELASASGGAASTYDFAGVAYRQELLSSNAAGMESFNSDVIRAIQYISNDSYKRIILPSQLSIAAAEAAATAPIIADFVVLRSDDTDPFEHGLASTAVGLTDRPEIIIRFQAPAPPGDFGSTQQTQLQTLYNATTAGTGATVFSVDALQNASGSGLDADGVRAAIGLAAANLDTQLADLPTVAEFEARSLPSAEYFVVGDYTAPDNASIAAILTDTGTTIPATLAAIQGGTFDAATDSLEAIRNRGDAAWATATGFSTHAAADVWAVATRTVTGGDVIATNMRGTDGALTDFSGLPAVTVGTNQDKTGYSLTQSFPANFALMSIDGSGNVATAGDDAATIYTYFTDGTRADAFKATGFSTLTAAQVWTYTDGDRTLSGAQATAIGQIGTINSTVSACLSAATAVADGRHLINYSSGTATQYNADGNSRTVFDLYQADGTTRANDASNAVERRPQ